MNRGNKFGEADALAARIIANNEDPATWKIAARREAERLKVRLDHVNFDGCMRDVAWSIVERVMSNGGRLEDINP